jgi:hypothetical protein
MNWRFTLIVFLVFAVLAVFAYTQLDAPARQVGEGAPTATPEALISLDVADVQEVLVESEDGSYTLSRVAGGWHVDGEDTNDEVDGVVERLADLKVIRDLPSDRDPGDYGFATAALTVTLKTAAGDEHVLQIGDDTPVDYNAYVRRLGGDRIVIMSRGDIERLRDWLDTPPLAPTPTPEVEPTDEGAEGDGDELGESPDDDENGAEDGDAEVDDGEADESGAGEGDEADAGEGDATDADDAGASEAEGDDDTASGEPSGSEESGAGGEGDSGSGASPGGSSDGG